MYKCTKCGREFKTNGDVPDHSYGFKKGEPFIKLLCDDCKNAEKKQETSKEN